MDDLKAKLEAVGIPVGSEWASSKERAVRSPIVEKQKELLRQMEGLLEGRIQEDIATVADLHVSLQRIRKGGGVTRG